MEIFSWFTLKDREPRMGCMGEQSYSKKVLRSIG